MQNRHQWKPNHLTAPKSPLLQTSLRARPPKIKSSEELEKEELEKIPEFKARPLNRKVVAFSTFDDSLDRRAFLEKTHSLSIFKLFRYLKVKGAWGYSVT